MYKSKEYLQREYIEKGRTQSDIAREWDVCPKLLHYYIKKFNLTGIKSKRKYTSNEGKYIITDPVFNYYAGLIATDGYIDLKNNRVSLRLKNEGSYEVLSNLKDYFEFSGEIKEYKGSNDLTITSDKLIQALSSLNIKGEAKTYNLKFPKIFSSDEDCQRMYIRGVLDGDGNINVKKSKYTDKYVGGQFRVVTSSEDFIVGLINYLNRKFKFNERLTYCKVKDVRYPKLEMKVGSSKIMYDWVYENYPNFRLKDKYDRYRKLIG